MLDYYMASHASLGHDCHIPAWYYEDTDKQPTRWHLRPSHWSKMYLFLEQETHYHEHPVAQHFWGILEHPQVALLGQAPHRESLILCSARQAGTRARGVHLAWEVPSPKSNVLETRPRRCWTLLTPQPIAFPLGQSRCRKEAFFQTPNQVPAAFKTHAGGCPHPLSYRYTEFKCECEDLGVEPSFCHRTQLRIFHCSSHFMFAGYRADPVEAVPFWL